MRIVSLTRKWRIDRSERNMFLVLNQITKITMSKNTFSEVVKQSSKENCVILQINDTYGFVIYSNEIVYLDHGIRKWTAPLQCKKQRTTRIAHYHMYPNKRFVLSDGMFKYLSRLQGILARKAINYILNKNMHMCNS